MSELPTGWAVADFGDLLVEAANGCSARRGHGVPTVVLRLADVSTSGEVATEGLRLVPLSEKAREKYALREDDLIAFRVNGSRDIAGRVIRYPGPDGYAFCDHFIRFRIDNSVISPAFAAKAFRAWPVRSQVERRMVSTAGQNTVSQGSYREVEVPLPPLNEQRRIVAKIEALQERSRAAREALEAIPPLLDRFRQSVLAAAFRGDLTADWRANNPNVEPASVLLDRIRKERRHRWEQDQLAKMKAKGKEPKDDKWKAKYKEPEPVDTEVFGDYLSRGWTCYVLEHLVDPTRGVPYGIVKTGDPVVGGVPTVRCGDIKRFAIDLGKLKLVRPAVTKQYRRTRLLAGEVLVAIRGTVGATAVAGPEMVGMNISREVAMIPVLPGIEPAYLMYLIASPPGQALIHAEVKGVAQSGINLADLRQLPMPVPPRAEQREIVARLEALLARANQVKHHSVKLASQVDTLDQSTLAAAFRGELVPQDPNDEPASVLLARIRSERQTATPKKASRGRRSKKGRKAAPTDDPEPAPPRPSTTRAKNEPRSPTTPPFLDSDADAQIEMVFNALVTAGLLEVDEAIRQVADRLRDAGASDHKRLRRGGGLSTAIEHALKLGARRGYFDRPRRGYVRAIMADPKEYDRDHWRAALLASLDGEPTDRDDALRAAADWAAENMGLEFKRLRSDGVVMNGLKSALSSAIRGGEVARVGSGQVKRVEAEDAEG